MATTRTTVNLSTDNAQIREIVGVLSQFVSDDLQGFADLMMVSIVLAKAHGVRDASILHTCTASLELTKDF